MSQNPELPPSLLNFIPWNPQKGSIWAASTLTLRRNLARYNFPSKLQGPEVNQVVDALKKGLLELSYLDHPRFYSSKELTSADRELILEHFLALHGFKEPPNSTGMVIDEKGTFLALINSENHLEMRSLNIENHWENTWNQLLEIEHQIGKSNDFAFSPKFGYLTSDPSQCGTGLTVQAYLHVPALTHTNQLKGALSSSEEEEIQFISLSGNLDELIGDMIVLQNNFTLGISEEAILHSVQTAGNKLVGAEKALRTHLKQQPSNEIKDRVSKAFGLILHSYQLETKEALDLLSILKLGLVLDYIKGVEDEKLSALFFKCRRGYLTHLFPDLKDAKELSQKRAEFLRQELQGIQLS